MIILYNKIELSIKQESASFGTYENISFSSPVEHLNRIYSFVEKRIPLGANVFVKDYFQTDTNLIFLYVLTLLKCVIYYLEEEHELSFAYAIPIKSDIILQKFVAENLELCIKNNQIVFLPTKTLYLYKSIQPNGLATIIHDERKTIKKNELISIAQVDFSDDFYDFWKEFDKVRFNEQQTQNFQDFFRYVYSTLEFKLFKYSVHNQLVAYNVCYYSETQKIIYDVLFPWVKNDNAYRIGIFSMIKNLEKAYEMGWGYSICYGIYNYKNAVLNKLGRD